MLVAYETSGTVRRAFEARGWDAYSCDILPADDNSPQHFQMPIEELMKDTDFMSRVILVIAHPPCTYLCSSGLHWNKRVPGRADKTEQALEDVRWLIKASQVHGFHLVIENPTGCISTRIAKPTQKVQPYQYGHDASKGTCFWIVSTVLRPLMPTQYIEPRMVSGKPRWANQTDSGQNKLGPSEDRWKERSKTYEGIAEAMADQWGNQLLTHLQ